MHPTSSVLKTIFVASRLFQWAECRFDLPHPQNVKSQNSESTHAINKQNERKGKKDFAKHYCL